MQIFILLNAKLHIILKTLRILHAAKDSTISQPDKSDFLAFAIRG